MSKTLRERATVGPTRIAPSTKEHHHPSHSFEGLLGVEGKAALWRGSRRYPLLWFCLALGQQFLCKGQQFRSAPRRRIQTAEGCRRLNQFLFVLRAAEAEIGGFCQCRFFSWSCHGNMVVTKTSQCKIILLT